MIYLECLKWSMTFNFLRSHDQHKFMRWILIVQSSFALDCLESRWHFSTNNYSWINIMISACLFRVWYYRGKTLQHCFRCSAFSITKVSRKRSFVEHDVIYKTVDSSIEWFHISWRCYTVKPVRNEMSILSEQRYRFCDRFTLFIITRTIWFSFILSFTFGLEISWMRQRKTRCEGK